MYPPHLAPDEIIGDHFMLVRLAVAKALYKERKDLSKMRAERDELVVFVKRAQMMIKQSKSDTEDLIEELGPNEVNGLWMDELRQLDQNADLLLSKYKTE